MFLLNFYHSKTALSESGSIKFQDGTAYIKKWSLLVGRSKIIDILQLIAVSCFGKNFLSSATEFGKYISDKVPPEGVRFEFEMARHAPRDCSITTYPFFATGLEIMPDGRLVCLGKTERQHCRTDIPWKYPSVGTGIRKHFALAYGPQWKAHSGSDTFDFSGRHQRLNRFASLFFEKSLLTDNAAFLQRLHYRVRKNRLPAVKTLELLVGKLKEHFGINTDSWLSADADFKNLLFQLSTLQQRLLLPIIDMVRHIMDASPHELEPLARPGIIVFFQPQTSCPAYYLPAWFNFLDRLFVNIQFIVGLTEESFRLFPVELKRRRLVIPKQAVETTKKKIQDICSLNSDDVLLVDVDGRMPNLALMKLSTWFRNQGRRIRLVRHDNWKVKQVETVYASCIFTFESSQRRVDRLRKKFGNRLHIGGSGVNIKHRLAPEIETIQPDYNLYPVLAERAMGFLTRGCSRKCDFCLVHEKEGLPRQVTELDDLLQGRRKLILLDDNILAFSGADRLLEEIVENNIQVNFNQTLDLRLVEQSRAAQLRRIRCANYKFTRSNYHFSLNDLNDLDTVRRNYELFNFRPRRDNVEFVCMYGFNTSFEEDVERFRFIRSLPGAYVFVQEYRPFPGSKKPDLDHFFTDKADEFIDQLVKIIFPQNMKSMEKYYHWLSRRYFKTFGKIHKGLVDTIFRYNLRDQKGTYIAKMFDGG